MKRERNEGKKKRDEKREERRKEDERTRKGEESLDYFSTFPNPTSFIFTYSPSLKTTLKI